MAKVLAEKVQPFGLDIAIKVTDKKSKKETKATKSAPTQEPPTDEKTSSSGV